MEPNPREPHTTVAMILFILCVAFEAVVLLYLMEHPG